MVTCLILIGGTIFQVIAQRALGKHLFSLENLKENDLGLSGVRCAEIILVAPLREEIMFRYFALHIVRNRLGERSSVLVCGALFGAVHLQNAFGSRFALSYVAVQVFQHSTSSHASSEPRHSLTCFTCAVQYTSPSSLRHLRCRASVHFNRISTAFQPCKTIADLNRS
eukprot:1496769-Rhodomonas_salina.1